MPQLVSKLAKGALTGKIDADVVVSRSARPALGGQVSEVVRLASGGFKVNGPWGTTGDIKSFGAALKVARKGPQA